MIWPRRTGFLAFAILSLTSSVAWAQAEDGQPVSDAARAEALTLFDTGRGMMQEPAKLDAACDTLTKSYALHNRGDTLLNLAECHRRQGKTATAWREFDEAIRYAEAVAFTEAIAAAVKLRDELAKDLSKLVVEVAKDPARKKTEVILDGKRLPEEQWGEQLFVDPGLHTVTATAEGHEPFSGSADVKKQADRAAIVVTLKKTPVPPPPKKVEPPPPKPVEEADGVPVWAIVVGGAGVAMLGVSTAFGIDTVSVVDELDTNCGADRTNCPGDYEFEGPRSNELRSFGLFVGFGIAGIGATAAGVIGLVAGVTGGSSSDVAIVPIVTPDFAGLTVGGRFR